MVSGGPFFDYQETAVDSLERLPVLGYKRVHGTSMEPVIGHGTEVLLDFSRRGTKAGDVVVIRGWDGCLCLHRVKACWSIAGTMYLCESGDGDEQYSVVTGERVVATAILQICGGLLRPIPPRLTAISPVQARFLRLASCVHPAVSNRLTVSLCCVIAPTLIMYCRRGPKSRGLWSTLSGLAFRVSRSLQRARGQVADRFSGVSGQCV